MNARILIQLEPEELERVDAAAEGSRSAWIRQAILAALGDEPKSESKPDKVPEPEPETPERWGRSADHRGHAKSTKGILRCLDCGVVLR